MAAERLFDYLITCVGGLEEVAVDELTSHLGETVQGLRVERGSVGRLFFRYERSPARLLELRCPTGLFAIARQAHDVTVGRPGLERIARCLRDIPRDAVRRLVGACGGDAGVFELTVSMRGAHRFSARDVEQAARQVLHSEHGWRPGHGAPQPMRLSVQVQKRRALVVVGLGPRRLAGDPTREGWAGPAAASVSRLLDLGPDDGFATVPGAGGPAGAGSIWIGSGEGGGAMVRSDPRSLPLQPGALVAAMVAAADADRAVPVLRAVVEILPAGGVVALLVPGTESLGPQLQQAGLPLEPLAALPYHVRRRRWGLFLLECLDRVSLEVG